MPRYERMPLHDESHRAPIGVCEISIQASTNRAFEQAPSLEAALVEYVDESLDVRAYEYDDPGTSNRIVVQTGTDRLDLATLRDISEVYGQITEYGEGNIPPELSIVPTTDKDDVSDYFVWFEMKLELELPTREVEHRVKDRLGDLELVPKNPVGENMEAIVFRDNNVANHQVRDVLNKASKIRDSVPVDYIRLVCEPKR